MTDSITRFRGEYYFLSNFFPVPHGVYGYQTNEHFFQAMKSIDPVYRDQVKRCMTPGQAKRMGRAVALRPDWNEISREVMLSGLRFKFKPGSELAAQLLATGDALLVEGNNWHDNYWGDCECGNGRCRLVAQNHLGELLMYVREELANA